MLRRKKNPVPSFDPDEILFDSVSALRSDFTPEGRIERPIGRTSAIVFLVLLSAGIIYLSYRAGVLQIRDGAAYLLRSQENRFFVRKVLPPRGVIFDRAGAPLVENAPSYGVRFDRDLFLSARGDLPTLLGSLGRLLEKPPSYFSEIGFPESGDPAAVPRSAIVAQDIPPERFLAIAYELHALPGVEVFENFRRVYAEPVAAAHLVGFLGEVSPEDLAGDSTLSPGDFVGKSGVEAQYDSILRGEKGKKIIETDAQGNETRYKLVEESRPGGTVELTIDRDLQVASYRVFSSYVEGKKAGSVTALDPRTGEVLALVSYPSFDANAFSGSLSVKEFQAILENPLRPLVNRPIAGEYAPGSTVKPMFAAAALAEGVVKDTRKKIYDPGYLDVPNPFNPGEPTRFVDWRPHGWIDFYDAIALSANVFFYIVGGGTDGSLGLGIERLERYARMFGFGEKLGIDLPGEQPGLFPNPEWKKTAEPEDPIWRIGDTYNTSIGQGGVKATPLQIASMTAVVANGGTLWQPYVLKSARARDGTVLHEGTPVAIRTGILPDSVFAEVRKGMRQGVTSGTVQRLSTLPVPVAAKTGTAQIGGMAAPHAWVTVIAPVDDPKIVLTVMIENAGSGVTAVTPIARDILERYFTRPSPAGS